jgi:hypothetical protein
MRKIRIITDEVQMEAQLTSLPHLIKSISYGKEEIGVDIFYLPKGYLSNLSIHRAYQTGRALIRLFYVFEKSFKMAPRRGQDDVRTYFKNSIDETEIPVYSVPV